MLNVNRIQYILSGNKTYRKCKYGWFSKKAEYHTKPQSRRGKYSNNKWIEMIEIKETSSDLVPKKLLLLADPSIDRINQYLMNSLCYTATIQNEIVGVCVLKTIDKKSYELFNIAVSPEHQEKGIGSQLLRYALGHLKERNVKSVELGTGTFGYQLTFYQRFGFRVDSIHKDYFINNYDEPIYENGIQLKDMLRLRLKL